MSFREAKAASGDAEPFPPNGSRKICVFLDGFAEACKMFCSESDSVKSIRGFQKMIGFIPC